MAFLNEAGWVHVLYNWVTDEAKHPDGLERRGSCCHRTEGSSDTKDREDIVNSTERRRRISSVGQARVGKDSVAVVVVVVVVVEGRSWE